jgi:hypothetical protein
MYKNYYRNIYIYIYFFKKKEKDKNIYVTDDIIRFSIIMHNNLYKSCYRKIDFRKYISLKII